MSPKARRKARMLAMQALYQWSIVQDLPASIEAQYRADNDHFKVDWEFFSEIMRGAIEKHVELDAKFSAFLKTPLEETFPVELALLRLATFELSEKPDVPPTVVVNEYVELAKEFGTEDGYKFINGVLANLL